jgi:hypothetical protein
MKKGKQFGYIRRYSKELRKTSKTFFNDLKKEGVIPRNTKTEFKGSEFLLDGKVIGHAFSLSTAMGDRGLSFPEVDFLIFDEFMLDPRDYMNRYLPNEVDALENLIETIFRDREGCRIVMLGNNFTEHCPYFIEWDLEYPSNKKKTRLFHDGFILVELVEGNKFKEHKRNTRRGKFLQGSSQGDFMIENKALRDNKNLVKKRPEKTRYFFTIVYEGNNYGVWIDDKNLYYVSSKFDPNHKIKFVARIDDMDNTTMSMKNAYMSETFTMFIKAFEIGRVYFEEIKLKNILIGIMRTRGRM